MCVSEGEIHIIDYKTSKRNMDENIAQITAYKEAVVKIYPNFKVKAALFYALEGKIEHIEI